MHWKPVYAFTALALGLSQAQAAGVLNPTVVSVAVTNPGSNKTFADVLNFNMPAGSSQEITGTGGSLNSGIPLGLYPAGLGGPATGPLGAKSQLADAGLLREQGSDEPASGEPETYLVLLASAAVVGFLFRRRRDN